MSRYIKETLGKISGNLSVEAFVGDKRVFCEICSMQELGDVRARAKAKLRTA